VQAVWLNIAGVSTRTLRDIEKEVANPEPETLMKIGTLLGIGIKAEIIQQEGSSPCCGYIETRMSSY